MIAIHTMLQQDDNEEPVEEVIGTIKATADGLINRFRKQKPTVLQQRQLARKYSGLNQNLSSAGRAYG